MENLEKLWDIKMVISRTGKRKCLKFLKNPGNLKKELRSKYKPTYTLSYLYIFRAASERTLTEILNSHC